MQDFVPFSDILSQNVSFCLQNVSKKTFLLTF